MQGLVDQVPERTQRADRIGVGSVAGEREGLAAAATEDDRLPGTGAAWLLHPRVTPERLEGRRLVPDPLDRVLAHARQLQRWDRIGAVARQRLAVRRHHDVIASPPAVARFGQLL